MDKLKLFQDVFHQSMSVDDAMNLLLSNNTSENELSVRRIAASSPYITNHLVYDKAVMLGVTYVSVGLDKILLENPDKNIYHLSKVLFQAPVILEEDQEAVVTTHPMSDSNHYYIQVEIEPAKQSITAASFCTKELNDDEKVICDFNLNGFITKANRVIKQDEIYDKMKSVRVDFGPALKTVQKAYVQQDEVVCELKNQIPSQLYQGISPVFLDGAIVGSLSPLSQNEKKPFVPMMVHELIYKKTDKEVAYSHSKLKKVNSEVVILDLTLYAMDGSFIAKLEDVTLKKVENAATLMESSKHLSPSKKSLKKPLKQSIIDYLVAKVRANLDPKPSEVSLTRNFLDLGLESNQLVEFVETMEQEMKIELYPTLFFEYQNIEEVTDYLLKEHQEKVSTYFEQSEETEHKVEETVAETANEIVSESIISVTDSTVEETSESMAEFLKGESFSKENTETDIAIIGMDGRFADSDTLDEFWINLIENKDLIREIPKDHFDVTPWFSEDMNAKNMTYSKWGSFIDHVDLFDSEFFHISPKEAEAMDPQLRLLLQVIYHTAEDAGVIKNLRGTKTGMYVGACFKDYSTEMDKTRKPVEPYDGSGNAQTMYANRPSFFFDLKGPSLAVDTACSSSLVAVHLACKALQNGECDMAFAAGINLLLSPWHYRYFSSIQALSPTGRCHTFDEKADGYVPGEGIGAILLKPLNAAIRDGDHIRCVIKGSAVNHGGYTPSITAPSMKLETKVVVEAWKNAKINPENLGYIETHGTGTKLGDPIEVNALKEAFKEYTEKEDFCVLGSAKANIGHTEGAAGIAGVIKAALSIQNKMIPAMPNFHKLNSYINMKHTPLYINQEPIPWKCAPDKLRLAGISSFGFGGTYAHVVLEEYKTEENTFKSHQPCIFILSAKTEESLQQYCRDLSNYLSEHKETYSLEQIASTLAFNRMEYECRKAYVASDIDDFIDWLNDSVKEELLSSTETNNKFVHAGKEEIAQAIALNDLKSIAQLWVNGCDIPWEQIMTKYPVISLPGYHFIGKRFWVLDKYKVYDTIKDCTNTTEEKLHYLLDSNISTFTEQKYCKVFAPEEPYVKAHVIQETHVLPGVITLEMVHTAIQMANTTNQPYILTNFVWSQPILVKDEPVKVYTEFIYQEDKFTIHVYSLQDHEMVTHARGELIYTERQEQSSGKSEQINQLITSATHVYSGTECYEMLRKQGLSIGDTLRGMKKLYVSENEMLVELASDFLNDLDFLVHPTLFDASIQSMIGFSIASDVTLHVPSIASKITYEKKLGNQGYAYLKLSSDTNREKKDKVVDIVLFDETKDVAVTVKGLVLKPFFLPATTTNKQSGKLEAFHMVYQMAPLKLLESNEQKTYYLYSINGIAETSHQIKTSLERLGHTVILISSIKELENNKNQDIFLIYVEEETTDDISNSRRNELKYSLEQMFTFIKQLLNTNASIHMYYCYNQSLNQSMEGFLKSVSQEESRFTFQMLAFDEKTDLNLRTNEFLAPCNGEVVICQENQRKIQQLEMLQLSENGRLFQDKKVYLITGGMGALGIAVATYLMKNYQVCLVLVGRHSEDETIHNQILSLNQISNASQAEYICCDITVEAKVNELISYILRNHHQLDGILQIAGASNDGLLRNKKLTDAKEVIAPKVDGTIILDLATRNVKLDFFLLFSSIASVNGNAGQSDYAYANSFLNAFAKKRNEDVKAWKAFGHTLSIAWPYWKDGNIHASKKALSQMKERFGLLPISTEEGLKLLDYALPYENCIVYLKVADEKIETLKNLSVMTESKATASTSKQLKESATSFMSENELEKELTQCLATVLGIRATSIKREKKMSDYGLESISITEFAKELSDQYKILVRPSIFYETDTIKDLAEYLLRHYKEAFVTKQEVTVEQERTNCDEISANAWRKEEIEEELPYTNQQNSEVAIEKKTFRFPTTTQLHVPSKNDNEPIAIVGMAGEMPGCDNMDEFYQALNNGDDLIRIVPASRWDWEAYYGDPKKEYGKTFCNKAGFLNHVDEFDADFFHISPREAASMDPQQRVFIQTVWECIENAGYKPSDLAGSKTGLFVGVGNFDYSDLMKEYQTPIDSFSSTGIAHSMLANRISYMFNLRGISEPIDTACSSSLVAIHHAMKSIKEGYCDLAIAGGVNLILTPNMTLAFSKAGMLSKDCACKTFDESADGYVRGEGSGAILLKPLKKALEDGDYVHALILGGSVNHGGLANSLTAPNSKAQCEVIKDAYLRSNVTSDTITYIEAHGTGTKLGDPVEIEGLCNAFDVYSKAFNKDELPYCGIGSVKSNIGHTETAAGIASILKVVLGLEHQKLFASIHYKQCNPYIKLDETPFYVVDQTKPWKRKYDEHHQEIPRRAGVSSFGFGGVNAHIVMEEYTNSSRMLMNHCENEKNVLILSADSKEQLKEYAKRFLTYLDTISTRPEFVGLQDLEILHHIAYTLQLGREERAHRLAIVADSIQELKLAYHDFITDDSNRELYWYNQVKEDQEDLFIDVDLAEIAEKAVSDKNYEKIAKFWARGVRINWNLLYQLPLIRVPLPTYPFRRTSYWLSQENTTTAALISRKATLCPVLDDNISDYYGLKYHKKLTKQDFFVRDHIINKTFILPGVVYLEMAMQSATLAMGKNTIRELDHIVWKNSIAIEETGFDVEVALEKKHENFTVKVNSHTNNQMEEHFQCDVQINESFKDEETIFDLDQLKERLSHTMTAEHFYEDFKEKGLALGSSLQGVKELHRNETECLLRYALPEEQRKEFHKFILHPSIMDAAITSPKAMLFADLSKLYIPFSIDSVLRFGALTEEGFIYTKQVKDSISSQHIQKFNIYILDTTGKVQVAFMGFLPRMYKTKEEIKLFSISLQKMPLSTQVRNKSLKNVLVFDPLNEMTLSSEIAKEQENSSAKLTFVTKGSHFEKVTDFRYLVNTHSKEEIRMLLETIRENEVTIFYRYRSNVAKESVENRNDKLAPLMNLYQVLIEMSERLNVTLYVLAETDSRTLSTSTGIDGFIQSVNQENSKMKGKVLHIIDANPFEVAFSELNSDDPTAIIYYQGNDRFVRTWTEHKPQALNNPALKIKEKHNYLISGGLGNLGFMVALDIVKQGGNVILTGRSAIDSEKSQRLSMLNSNRACASYYACDMSERTNVEELLEKLHEKGIQIHGIFHLAGISKDALLKDKTYTEFESVIHNKLDSVYALDFATRNEPLDFFLIYSSITGIVGNYSQSDYAYANAALDDFVALRNKQVDLGVANGKTKSISWSLWEDSGIKINDTSKEYLEHTLGMVPFTKADGMKTLWQALNSKQEHVIALKGDFLKLQKMMGGYSEKKQENVSSKPLLLVSEPQKDTVNDMTDFYQNLEAVICSIIRRNEKIDSKKDLSFYGFDSITYSELAEKLNDCYDFNLSPAFFFEYSTLEKVYQYLLKENMNEIRKVHQVKELTNSLSAKCEDAVIELQAPKEDKSEFMYQQSESDDSQKEESLPAFTEIKMDDEDIAVIGLNCKMPQSKDAKEFFEHLMNGDDLISVVPKDRWDWESYYGDPKVEENKTFAKWGGFMDETGNFDSKFFHISPKEATLMDPQHRLFIQCVWNTLEDAGYKADDLRGSNTGLFVGISGWDYNEVLRANTNKVEALSVIGIAHSVLPNRISYLMDWHGPSEPIDTACSSSLVAVHRAVQEIRLHHCDYAVAGGVNLILTPTVHISFSKAGMLSPTGQCKTFDQDADGYVRGEGVGAILLKRYSKAVEDGDHIYAVIKGSAINHGGQVNSFTVPNPNAQADVIYQAWQNANVDANTISYIEAHGTGTNLGDPVEIQGLKKAFDMAGVTNFENKFCGIGSVKSNLGHLESAAGIAGILKVILALYKKELPPTIHFQHLNPHIRMEKTPLYIMEHGKPWITQKDSNQNTIPRRAGISAFGFGGVNAHIVLEEAPTNHQADHGGRFEDMNSYGKDNRREQPKPFVLSAKTKEQLLDYANAFVTYFKSSNDSLSDISYTMITGRVAMEYRLGFYMSSKEDALLHLSNFIHQVADDQVYYHDVKPQYSLDSRNNEDSEITYNNSLQQWVYGQEEPLTKEVLKETFHRISLPVYPFAKVRHWIKETKCNPTDEFETTKIRHQLSEAEFKAIEQITYTCRWEKHNITFVPDTCEQILIITNRAGLELAKSIQTYYKEKTCNIIQTDDFNHCASKIEHADHIYYLAQIKEQPIDFAEKEILDTSIEEGIYRFFELFKLLDEFPTINRKRKLTVVTENVCNVTNHELLNPMGGSLFGFLNTAVKEYFQLEAVCIDIDGSELSSNQSFATTDNSKEELVASICEEPCKRELNYIAYRGNKRYQRILLPVTLKQKESAFREHGVYVILGGMGGIGCELSKYLAKHYHAKIAVIGRSQSGTEKIHNQAKTIEELGGKFLYVRADAGDITQMKAAILTIEQTYSRIHGVIHSAIVLNDMPISKMERKDLQVSLWPKVNGSIGLYEAVKGKNLDFMLFLSSVQSFTGMRGQSNYSAACTFKDAFSKYVASKENWNVRVINWGYWGSIGIVSSKEYQDRMKKQGVYSIEPTEGMACIETVLANPVQQVLVVKGEKEVLESIGIHQGEQCIAVDESIISRTNDLAKPKVISEIIDDVAGYELLDDYSRYQLLKVFQSRGLFLLPNEVIGIDEVSNIMCVLAQYERLFTELLGILERGNYIELIGNEVQTTENVCNRFLETKLSGDGLRKEHPEIVGYLNLIDTCMASYCDILCGKVEATNIMFPDGSMDLVGQVYKGNPLSDFYNDRIGKEIVSYVKSARRKDATVKVHILEIGAGTGGTSQGVLEKLKEVKENVTYTYTDISESFLKYGKHMFGVHYPFMDFKIFDAEKETSEDIGYYDIAFGSNVLHATSNIDTTLSVVKQKLKKNGILLVNEMVAKEDYVTLTFGLLEGWWLYQDSENRIIGSPLLDPMRWENAMKRNGYSHFSRANQGECERLPQDIIVGVSDGVIYRKNITNPTTVPTHISQTITSKTSRKEKILAKVKECLANVLGMEETEFDLETPFVDLGIDSILSMEFIQAINQSLNITLRPTELYSSSNLSLLTDKIQTDYQDFLAEETLEQIPVETQPKPQSQPQLKPESKPESKPLQQPPKDKITEAEINQMSEENLLSMLENLYNGTTDLA